MSVVHRDGRRTLSWPRVSASCDYCSPVRFEDEVTVEVCVAEMGDKSVTYHFHFSCRDRSVAIGRITTVCCQLADDGGLASVTIPGPVADQLRQIHCTPPSETNA